MSGEHRCTATGISQRPTATRSVELRAGSAERPGPSSNNPLGGILRSGQAHHRPLPARLRRRSEPVPHLRRRRHLPPARRGGVRPAGRSAATTTCMAPSAPLTIRTNPRVRLRPRPGALAAAAPPTAASTAPRNWAAYQDTVRGQPASEVVVRPHGLDFAGGPGRIVAMAPSMRQVAPRCLEKSLRSFRIRAAGQSVFGLVAPAGGNGGRFR